MLVVVENVLILALAAAAVVVVGAASCGAEWVADAGRHSRRLNIDVCILHRDHICLSNSSSYMFHAMFYEPGGRRLKFSPLSAERGFTRHHAIRDSLSIFRFAECDCTSVSWGKINEFSTPICIIVTIAIISHKPTTNQDT